MKKFNFSNRYVTVRLQTKNARSFLKLHQLKGYDKKVYKVMNQLGLFMPFEVNLMHALNMINYSNL